MTNKEILHVVKKMAQYRKNQCWLCKKLEKSIDILVMELIRRDQDGVDNNTDSNCIGDDRWTKIQATPQVWHPDSFINCCNQEEEIQGDGSTSTGCVS